MDIQIRIELANYELYSSFPREFSVSWSDVYPTVVWHLLGNFEAKDDRTMQIFELNTKNLGKFIKVVIYNHHGKEHYCPLSVIRILGYSMVQEFEAIEDEKNNPVSSVPRSSKATDNETISVSRNKSNPRDHAVAKQTNSDKPALNFLELCPLADVCLTHSNGKCVNNPLCRFLQAVMMKLPTVFCGFNISSNISETDHELAKFSSNGTADGNSPLVNLTNDRILIAENNQNRRMSEYSDIYKNIHIKTDAGEDSKNAVSGGYIDSRMHKVSTGVNNFIKSNNFTNASAVGDRASVADEFVKKRENELKNTCSCDNGDIKVPASQREFKAFKDNVKSTEVESAEDSVDSAGLIQKESVLIKLTSRIRTTEMDLNLINKYLQQLSQSYRSQMEDMKIMFDQTVRAVAIASEEAAAIDKKQQNVMTRLEERIIILGEKIQYQSNGQRHLLQRVVELHGFFLILEIIVISTICTIFLNMFNRLRLSLGDRRCNLVKLGS